MAAKGTESKIEVGNKIIDSFGEKAFWNIEGKEIRINVVENGEPLQIKVAFTVAKNAIDLNEVGVEIGTKEKVPALVFSEASDVDKIEASEEEKNAVADLMKELGL